MHKGSIFYTFYARRGLHLAVLNYHILLNKGNYRQFADSTEDAQGGEWSILVATLSVGCSTMMSNTGK